MPGRRWTAAEWEAFQRELDELERTDPEVRRAARRLDQVTWEIARTPPRRRFLRRLGGHSEPPAAPS